MKIGGGVMAKWRPKDKRIMKKRKEIKMKNQQRNGVMKMSSKSQRQAAIIGESGDRGVGA
jgi:hypothetical protein